MDANLDVLSIPQKLMQVSPIQYCNLLVIDEQAGRFVARWGRRALISGGVRAMQAVKPLLENVLRAAGMDLEKHIFRGECSQQNITTIAEAARSMEADLVIGVGGGKSLDAAKAAAWVCSVPVVTVPTIAATCAAVSPLSISYTPDGVFERALYLPSAPNLVIADASAIARAPTLYLASGIFDALAKWYEGSAVYRGISNPHVFTTSALRLAETLNAEMERQAVAALEQSRAGRAGEELRQIVDLNIYVTGIIQGLGFHTLRGGAAHAVHNGLTVLEESHRLLHGFKVGYGILVQQFLEGQPSVAIGKRVSLFRAFGLDPNLKRLGVPADEASLRRVAEMACADEAMAKMPFPVTVEMTVSAMRRLEEITNALKADSAVSP